MSAHSLAVSNLASQTEYLIYLTYPSGKESIDGVWKEATQKKKVIGWTYYIHI